MSLIEQITIGLAATTSVFDRKMARSGKVLDEFGAAAARTQMATARLAFDRIRPPAMPKAPALAGAGVAAGIGIYNGLAAAIGGAFDAVKDGVKGASDLNETLSKTEVILGAAAAPVKAFADEMASKFGLVKKETLDAASGFAGLGKGLGQLAGGDLARFSTEFTKLAADLQSQQNIGSLEEAASALRIALSGEQSDVLKRMGVIVNETTVKQYALAHGIKATAGALSEQQKLMVRSALIQKGLADASGDLERTADAPANAYRKFTGTLTNLATEIGGAVLPTLSRGLGVLNGWATAAGSFVAANKAAFASVAAAIGAGVATGLGLLRDLGAGLAETFARTRAIVDGWGLDFIGTFDRARQFVGGVVEGLGVLFRNLPDFLEIAGIKISEVVTNIGATFAVLPANLATIAEYISNNWYKAIADGVVASQKVFLNLAKNAGVIGKAIWDALNGKGFEFDPKALVPLLDGFKALSAELPELAKPALQSFQDQVDARLDAIGRREADRAARMAAAAKAMSPAMGATKAGAGDRAGAARQGEGGRGAEGAAALTFGSKEAYSAIARHRSQQGESPLQRKLADESMKQTQLQIAMAAALKDLNTNLKQTSTDLFPIG